MCACVQNLPIIYIYYVSGKFYIGKIARYDENIEQFERYREGLLEKATFLVGVGRGGGERKTEGHFHA